MSFKIFDLYAERYDDWFRRNRIVVENELKLLRRIGIDKPCLELGVGTGFFASLLGVDVGLDPSINVLRIARGRGIDVVQGFGELLPFKSSCFKTVLLIVTLCFLENPEAVATESIRVLVRGGKLVSCIVPGDSSWGKYYRKLGAEGHAFYSRARFFTVEEMNKLFEGVGLEILGAWGTLSFPPWETPRAEEPVEWVKGLDLGFVCVEYLKR